MMRMKLEDGLELVYNYITQKRLQRNCTNFGTVNAKSGTCDL